VILGQTQHSPYMTNKSSRARIRPENFDILVSDNENVEICDILRRRRFHRDETSPFDGHPSRSGGPGATRQAYADTERSQRNAHMRSSQQLSVRRVSCGENLRIRLQPSSAVARPTVEARAQGRNSDRQCRSSTTPDLRASLGFRGAPLAARKPGGRPEAKVVMLGTGAKPEEVSLVRREWISKPRRRGRNRRPNYVSHPP
jgi:hypothetical protein